MPSTGVQIPVFASTNKAGTAKETQHFIVLQPGDKEMTVNEGLLYVGDPSLTYYDPVNGSVRFYVPPEVKGPISVTVNPAGGMPIPRPALKTKEPNIYKIDYPVRPGETRFDLNYTVPTTNPMIFTDKLLHADASSNLVVPNGVTVKSDDLELAGTGTQNASQYLPHQERELQSGSGGTGILAAGAIRRLRRRQRPAASPGSEAPDLRKHVLDFRNGVRDPGPGIGAVGRNAAK